MRMSYECVQGCKTHYCTKTWTSMPVADAEIAREQPLVHRNETATGLYASSASFRLERGD